MTDSSIWSARSVAYNTRNLHEGRELSVITHKCENSQFIEIVHVKTLEALIQALGYLKSQSDGPVFFLEAKTKFIVLSPLLQVGYVSTKVIPMLVELKYIILLKMRELGQSVAA